MYFRSNRVMQHECDTLRSNFIVLRSACIADVTYNKIMSESMCRLSVGPHSFLCNRKLRRNLTEVISTHNVNMIELLLRDGSHAPEDNSITVSIGIG